MGEYSSVRLKLFIKNKNGLGWVLCLMMSAQLTLSINTHHKIFILILLDRDKTPYQQDYKICPCYVTRFITVYPHQILPTAIPNKYPSNMNMFINYIISKKYNDLYLSVVRKTKLLNIKKKLF